MKTHNEKEMFQKGDNADDEDHFGEHCVNLSNGHKQVRFCHLSPQHFDTRSAKRKFQFLQISTVISTTRIVAYYQ